VGKRRSASLATLRGFLLRQAMTTLGATFIKPGQVMSTRPDLFEPQLIAQLRRLQDRLPPFAFGRPSAHSTPRTCTRVNRLVRCNTC